MTSTDYKRKMTTIQESTPQKLLFLLVKVKEIHLGIIKSSEHKITIPHLKKCLRIDYKQTTNDSEQRLEDEEDEEERNIVMNNKHFNVIVCMCV